MNELKNLIKTYYDYQLMRIRIGNRLKKKKNGESQKINPKTNYVNIVENMEENKLILEEIHNDIVAYEKFISKQIKKIIHEHPLWKEYLKDIKGCGELMAGVIISEFDIYKADTVSKMCAYAGLSPGLTKGRKWNKNKTKMIITDELIRQDKKTIGFLCPFNQWLRSKLIGVLATEFIMCGNPKYKLIYENERQRLEAANWGVESKHPSTANKKAGHQNNAAKRKMIKIFLQDLYVAWRTLEGLVVTKPYAEIYLNRKHGNHGANIQEKTK